MKSTSVLRRFRKRIRVTMLMTGLGSLDVAGLSRVAIVRRRLYYRGRMLSMGALSLCMWSVG